MHLLTHQPNLINQTKVPVKCPVSKRGAVKHSLLASVGMHIHRAVDGREGEREIDSRWGWIQCL